MQLHTLLRPCSLPARPPRLERRAASCRSWQRQVKHTGSRAAGAGALLLTHSPYRLNATEMAATA